MTEGLKLRFGSKEIADHCTARADYHDGRAKEKAAELPGLRDALEKIKGSAVAAATPGGSNVSKGGYRMDNEDPIESLETDIRNHRYKVTTFRLLAAHLFDGEYTLVESDLVRLEMIRQF